MAPTYAAAEKGYFNLWNAAQIRANRQAVANATADKVLKHKADLLDVQKLTGVPWQWVGMTFLREADLNFKGAFANGDPIIGTGKKTYHVPAGRGPFPTWAASAVDEIKRRGLDKIRNWSVERMCFEWEAYNGWGYLGKCNTPYVYSWTTEYGPPESKGGKYVADHVFSYSNIDVQPGCAAILKALALIDPETTTLVENREPVPDEAVINGAIATANKGKRRAAVGAGVSAATGAAVTTHTVAAQPATPILQTPLALTMMGGGIVLVAVLVLLSRQTGNLLKARW